MARFSSIIRELRVVEFFGLHIWDPEEILHIFDVSIDVSIGEIKFWGQVARGGGA